MDKCPKCYRPLAPNAAQCVYSDCHTYFDRSALIWYERDRLKARKELWEAQKRREAEEKAAKKAARAAKKAAEAKSEG